MNDKELDTLLNRFASDEITEAEQQRLIDGLASLPEPEMPEMLGERLADTIDTLAETDRNRRAITPVRSRHMPPLRVITGIAAAVAVVITLGVRLFTATPAAVPPTPLDTCATPEEAYAEAQKALLIFSTAIDKGMNQVKMVEATTADVHDKVTRQLNHLNLEKV